MKKLSFKNSCILSICISFLFNLNIANAQFIPPARPSTHILSEVATFDEQTGIFEIPVVITGTESNPGEVFRNVKLSLNLQGQLNGKEGHP